MPQDEAATGSTGAEPVRVLICDDHALFRRGLMMVLEEQPGVEVVAEAENGAEAVAMAENFAPDVVLMDVAMPGLDGIEATRKISLLHPSARIIMLTVASDQDDLYEAIRAGAITFLLKESSIDQVADTVRAVVGGQTMLSPDLAMRVLAEFEGFAGESRADGSPHPTLAPREEAALRMVADGRSNPEIAAELDISENTVKNHLRNVLGKLHLYTRIEIARHEVVEGPGPPGA